jgi:2-polyprenyl-6-methoxyphenol hydroxylase-like FAD-dependent oxidoreductase
MKVLVVGGGIGGLTAARALLDVGFEVSVLERRPLAGMLSGPGGIFIQKNAMRVMEVLDEGRIAKRLYAEGGTVLDGGFFDIRGQPLYINRPSFAGEANLGVAVLRPVLQKILYESLPAGTVRTDAACERFHVEPNGVTIHLSTDEEIKADVLVGADGLRSKVRAHIGDNAAPVYSGQTCWRGAFRSQDVSLDPRYSWQEWWGVGSRFGYFNTGQGTACFYGFVNSAAGGGDSNGPLASLREHFSGYGKQVGDVIASLNEQAVYRDDIFDRDPPGNTWGTGPVTLLGDAAHPTQPTLGQGGCMAIEDGFELAKALKRGGPVTEAVRGFEAARTPRVGRVVRDSRNVALLANTPSPMGAWARNWVYRLTPRKLGDLQFKWLFDYRPQW